MKEAPYAKGTIQENLDFAIEKIKSLNDVTFYTDSGEILREYIIPIVSVLSYTKGMAEGMEYAYKNYYELKPEYKPVPYRSELQARSAELKPGDWDPKYNRVHGT